jgi:hypothetical protein
MNCHFSSWLIAHRYKNNKLSSRNDEKWQHVWGQCDMIRVVSMWFNNIGKTLKHFDSTSPIVIVFNIALSSLVCFDCHLFLFFTIFHCHPMSTNISSLCFIILWTKTWCPSNKKIETLKLKNTRMFFWDVPKKEKTHYKP